MNELLKPELEKIEELIRLLEEKKVSTPNPYYAIASTPNPYYAVTSTISFLQAIKNKIENNDDINCLKVNEIIDEQEKKVKEIIDKT